jgi:hypothetical protein
MYSGDYTAYKVDSLVSTEKSPIRFYAGDFGLTGAPFKVLADGSLYASAAEITGGKISIPGTRGKTSIDDFCLRVSHDERGWTQILPNGMVVYSSEDTTFNQNIRTTYDYLSLGHDGTYGTGGGSFGFYVSPYCSGEFVINVYPDYEGRLEGTWSATSCLGTTSDRTKKNTINDLPERYSALFDGLRPVTYKYNDGRSGRTHTGFIAQDVYDATVSAGLTSSDFAAVCYDIKDEQKVNWRIRYEEIIALNTWQIQRLKEEIERLRVVVYGTGSN